ncbi:MAG: GNAT family N-acetyltransferase [Dehalococcoidales bacterium]|nr:GNAT family N-acetyltransferase [Dehalococcoidales bacterium]
MNMIRRAEAKDVDGVLELLIQVDMVHHNARPDIFKGPATKYTREELLEIFKNNDTPVFVYADESGFICGHAFCILKQLKNDHVLTDIKTLYIDDICVHEKCRGMHIGKSLYEHVVAYAKEIGCYNVTLNVWCCNEDAMCFYEKLGLVPQKIGMEKIL